MAPSVTTNDARETIGIAIRQLAELAHAGGPCQMDRRALNKASSLLLDAADALDGMFVSVYPPAGEDAAQKAAQ